MAATVPIYAPVAEASMNVIRYAYLGGFTSRPFGVSTDFASVFLFQTTGPWAPGPGILCTMPLSEFGSLSKLFDVDAEDLIDDLVRAIDAFGHGGMCALKAEQVLLLARSTAEAMIVAIADGALSSPGICSSSLGAIIERVKAYLGTIAPSPTDCPLAKASLESMCREESDRRSKHAHARVIQRAWRRCVADPVQHVCRNRLKREWTNLVKV